MSLNPPVMWVAHFVILMPSIVHASSTPPVVIPVSMSPYAIRIRWTSCWGLNVMPGPCAIEISSSVRWFSLTYLFKLILRTLGNLWRYKAYPFNFFWLLHLVNHINTAEIKSSAFTSINCFLYFPGRVNLPYPFLCPFINFLSYISGLNPATKYGIAQYFGLCFCHTPFITAEIAF